jgi:hypothetical protein
MNPISMSVFSAFHAPVERFITFAMSRAELNWSLASWAMWLVFFTPQHSVSECHLVFTKNEEKHQ